MIEVQLHEVATVNMGTAPPGDTYNDQGKGVPMIAGAGDYGDIFPQPKKWTIAPTRIAKKGDLIVCVRATIGDLNWADQEYCLGRGVAGIRAHQDKLDIRYLAHYLDSKKTELSKLGTGSTFLAIRRADLEEFPIPLPPLAEQRRIAAILDKADAIRRKRQRAIALCEDFLRSAFLEMFGDPVTNPRGWPVYPFGELIENKDSNRIPLKESDRDNRHGPFPYYGSVGIIDYIDDYLFEGEHLLISEDGKHLESRNRPVSCIATGKFWVNNHAHVLAYNNKADLCYLAWNIQLRPLKRFVTGIDQFKLNRANLDQIPVPTPPIKKQLVFRKIQNHISELKNTHKLTLQKSDELFRSLTHLAFRGELTQASAEKLLQKTATG